MSFGRTAKRLAEGQSLSLSTTESQSEAVTITITITITVFMMGIHWTRNGISYGGRPGQAQLNRKGWD